MSKLETLKQMYDSGATADGIARALKVNDQWVAQAIATHVRTVEAEAKAAAEAASRKKAQSAYMREYDRRPEVVARRRAYQAEYSTRPEVKKKRRAYNRARYHRLKAEKLAAEKLAASEVQS